MPDLWTTQLGVKRTLEEQKKWEKKCNKYLKFYVILCGSIIAVALLLRLLEILGMFK